MCLITILYSVPIITSVFSSHLPWRFPGEGDPPVSQPGPLPLRCTEWEDWSIRTGLPSQHSVIKYVRPCMSLFSPPAQRSVLGTLPTGRDDLGRNKLPVKFWLASAGQEVLLTPDDF